ncbi:hypothetical protein [Desulfosarcina variabilis]|uniref:hypothetical protein n=1 Tax=Desulfosarcina variabilis TaxID=2300 RepID=UPI003AFB0130
MNRFESDIPRPVPIRPKVQPPSSPSEVGYSSWARRIGAFLTAVVLLSGVWFGLMSQIGSITGSVGFDLVLWVCGVAFFFYDYILTENGFRWAEKHCGLWGRKGGG